jgi:hypothetical protein
MKGDTQSTARQASVYLADERVSHYWDLWKFGSRTYAKQFGIPEDQAWDMFVFYKPYITWRDSPPQPTFWMQARNLKAGDHYTKDGLEAELRTWLE